MHNYIAKLHAHISLAERNLLREQLLSHYARNELLIALRASLNTGRIVGPSKYPKCWKRLHSGWQRRYQTIRLAFGSCSWKTSQSTHRITPYCVVLPGWWVCNLPYQASLSWLKPASIRRTPPDVFFWNHLINDARMSCHLTIKKN